MTCRQVCFVRGGQLKQNITQLIFPFGQQTSGKGFLLAPSHIWISWLLLLWSSI
uniref:Uncharacterized protein n=1 Tax=Arundo donax TaxID=35708 RepID=A0A0A9GCG3_ARUDO